MKKQILGIISQCEESNREQLLVELGLSPKDKISSLLAHMCDRDKTLIRYKKFKKGTKHNVYHFRLNV